MLMETGPAKGQCLQTRFVPPGNTQTILLYPQNRLEKGWRVNEIRVFDKYDTMTKTCKGMCADGSMSPRCLARSVGAAQSRLSDQFIRTVVRWIRGGNSRNSSESTQIAYSSTSSSCVRSKTCLLVRSRYWLYQ